MARRTYPSAWYERASRTAYLSSKTGANTIRRSEQKHMLRSLFSDRRVPQSEGMKKLDFIFFDAGGGHRSAATALRQVIEQQSRAFEVRLVNLQEVLDPIDIFRKITGLRMQDLYNSMLKKGWTLGS